MDPIVLPLLPGRALGTFNLGSSIKEIHTLVDSLKVSSDVVVRYGDDLPGITLTAPSIGLVFVFHPRTQQLVQIIARNSNSDDMDQLAPAVYVEFLGTHIPVSTPKVQKNNIQRTSSQSNSLFEHASLAFRDLAPLLLHPLVTMGQSSQTDTSPFIRVSQHLGIVTLALPGVEAHFIVKGDKCKILDNRIVSEVIKEIQNSKRAAWLSGLDVSAPTQHEMSLPSRPPQQESPIDASIELLNSSLSWMTVTAKLGQFDELKPSLFVPLRSSLPPSDNESETSRSSQSKKAVLSIPHNEGMLRLDSDTTLSEAQRLLSTITDCSLVELPLSSIDPSLYYVWDSSEDESQKGKIQSQNVSVVVAPSLYALVCPSLSINLKFTESHRLKNATIFCCAPFHTAFMKFIKTGFGVAMINSTQNEEELTEQYERLENLILECRMDSASGVTIKPIVVSDTTSIFVNSLCKKLESLPCKVSRTTTASAASIFSSRLSDTSQHFEQVLSWSKFDNAHQAMNSFFESSTGREGKGGSKDGDDAKQCEDHFKEAEMMPTLFVQDDVSGTSWEFTIRTMRQRPNEPSNRILLQLAALVISFD